MTRDQGDEQRWQEQRREGYAAARMLGVVLIVTGTALITAGVLALVHATRTEVWALIVLALAGVAAANAVDAARKRTGRR